MLKRSFAVVTRVKQGYRRLGDRYLVHIDDSAATALRCQSPQIKRQAVADVDAGMQPIVLGQRKRFGHPWLEVEVMSENATAELAGNDDRIAGYRARAA